MLNSKIYIQKKLYDIYLLRSGILQAAISLSISISFRAGESSAAALLWHPFLFSFEKLLMPATLVSRGNIFLSQPRVV